jgi:hypothetical protein
MKAVCTNSKQKKKLRVEERVCVSVIQISENCSGWPYDLDSTGVVSLYYNCARKDTWIETVNNVRVKEPFTVMVPRVYMVILSVAQTYIW